MNDHAAQKILKRVAEQYPDVARELGAVSDFIWDCAVISRETESLLEDVRTGPGGPLLHERIARVKHSLSRLFGHL